MGTFSLLLTLPPTYPFKPPTVTFTTKVYHPNISNDTPPNSGIMCLGMLRDSEWKPSTKMAAVLEFVRQLLKGNFYLPTSPKLTLSTSLLPFRFPTACLRF